MNLKYATVPLVPQNKCSKILKGNTFDKNTMICAGGKVLKFDKYLLIYIICNVAERYSTFSTASPDIQMQIYLCQSIFYKIL